MKIVYRVTNISNHSVTLYSTDAGQVKVGVGESIIIESVASFPTLINLADPSLGVLKLRKEVLVDGE